jgi:hypothetical protein
MSKFGSRAYWFAADAKGFIMIVPQTTADRKCWDVGTPKSLKHDGFSDSHVLATMIKYTLEKYKADPKRVFVTGTSSGAMMTNVMCAVYPDLFAGGCSVFWCCSWMFRSLYDFQSDNGEQDLHRRKSALNKCRMGYTG